MRKDLLWNDGWEFTLQTVGEHTPRTIDNVVWHKVEIPHDWLIGNTEHLYETGEGWYRKYFTLEKETLDGTVYISFDGVYMNSTVYVNDEEVGIWRYGYSSFSFDITSFLKEGKNCIKVKITHEAPNTRWYSGAGIYRSVRLLLRNRSHIKPEGIYVNATELEAGKWRVKVSAEASCPGLGDISYKIYDKNGEKIHCVWKKSEDGYAETLITSPHLWDMENPSLYRLSAILTVDGNETDRAETIFGFRTVRFHPELGFMLNGRRIKIHGVCMHHDLGCLGAAMNFAALKRQLEILKSFGVNSIRTSHNMPSRELIDLCDEMGLLVDDESFDMWEIPKTDMDYARFFPKWYKKDVASWIKRDRNHPCVIMWSIGNEIPDTNTSERGLEIAKMLAEEVKLHDPLENARCTIASNYMPWKNAQNIADFLKLAGYNYAEKYYDEHHKNHPDWFIYGSETASAVRSREIYHRPADTPLLTFDDLQCSDYGNSVVGWGSSQEKSWIMDRDRDYCGGQYVWTGFDYIGEPTPYSTKNSYFGIVDTAGFPKESYYFYKSVWTDGEKDPFIHITPIWDWNEGEEISVYTYSNLEDVELFFDGKSLGKQHIDLLHGDVLHGEWKVKYHPGTLSAIGYRKDGIIAARDERKSFGEAARLVITPESQEMQANGRDLIFIKISAVDKDNNPVENARCRVKVSVSGAARLAGLDNGDSTDYVSYKGESKRLFSGKLLAVLQSTFESGNIKVSVSSPGLTGSSVTLAALPCDTPEGVDVADEYYPKMESKESSEIPVRKIALSADRLSFDPEHREAKVSAVLLPENATYDNISWKCAAKNGVISHLARIKGEGKEITVDAMGDGEFFIRAFCGNGKDHPEIVSDLLFTASGLGFAMIMPYQMVSASVSDYGNKLNIIAAGAASGFSGQTVIGFKNVDFGSFGSNEIEVFMGNSGRDPIPVEIWTGDPKGDGEKLADISFKPNGCWDSFAPEEFTLPERIKGVKDIAFVINTQCIFGGFRFKKPDKTRMLLSAGDCDEIYGDDYTLSGKRVEKIGNNVVLEFKDMDFGAGVSKITINGRTRNPVNTIQIRYSDNDGQKTQLMEFKQCENYEDQSFHLETISGIKDISFVFLPGSNFDFESFKFE